MAHTKTLGGLVCLAPRRACMALCRILSSNAADCEVPLAATPRSICRRHHSGFAQISHHRPPAQRQLVPGAFRSASAPDRMHTGHDTGRAGRLSGHRQALQQRRMSDMIQLPPSWLEAAPVEWGVLTVITASMRRWECHASAFMAPLHSCNDMATAQMHL